jgi:tetratricopeptide (TPR) repeat protein
MTRDSVAFALSGTFFGLLVGWMIGSQQAAPPVAAPAPQPAAQSAPATTEGSQPATLDPQEAAQLARQADANPKDAAVRVQLGNMYFDAAQYADAAKWYEQAQTLDPKDVDVSTDLAIAYFNLSEVDKALKQIDHSLSVNPKHAKTLLNQGIIRARGKKDLAGAAQSWQRLVAVAPDSEEAKLAAQGLDGIRAAQANPNAAPAGTSQ